MVQVFHPAKIILLIYSDNILLIYSDNMALTRKSSHSPSLVLVY